MNSVNPPNSSKEELTLRFARLYAEGRQLDKAIEAVLDGCVKQHSFVPSGRTLYTVVGRSGEEFIDPVRPFCSCKHFFFRVLGGRDRSCYHLMSYEIARETGLFDSIHFKDEEFGTFLRMLTFDLLKDKEDKDI